MLTLTRRNYATMHHLISCMQPCFSVCLWHLKGVDRENPYIYADLISTCFLPLCTKTFILSSLRQVLAETIQFRHRTYAELCQGMQLYTCTNPIVILKQPSSRLIRKTRYDDAIRKSEVVWSIHENDKYQMQA